LKAQVLTSFDTVNSTLSDDNYPGTLVTLHLVQTKNCVCTSSK